MLPYRALVQIGAKSRVEHSQRMDIERCDPIKSVSKAMGGECTQSCVCYVKLGLLAQAGPFTNGCRPCQNEKLPYLLTLTS